MIWGSFFYISFENIRIGQNHHFRLSLYCIPKYLYIRYSYEIPTYLTFFFFSGKTVAFLVVTGRVYIL